MAAGIDGTARSALLWTDLSTPKEASQLAVHKRRIDEVQSWLEQFSLRPRGDDETPASPHTRPKKDRRGKPALQGKSRVLVLKGPPGCGKSTVVRVVAQSLGLSVHEWTTPVPTLFGEQQHLGAVSDLLPYSQSWKEKSYVSKLDAFLAFLKSSTKFAPLQLQFQPHSLPAVQDNALASNLTAQLNASSQAVLKHSSQETFSSTTLEGDGDGEDVVLFSAPLKDKRRHSTGSKDLQVPVGRSLSASATSQRIPASEDEDPVLSKKPRQKTYSLDGAWGSLAFLSQNGGSQENIVAPQKPAGDVVLDLVAIRSGKRSKSSVLEGSPVSGAGLAPATQELSDSQNSGGRGRGKRKGRGRGSSKSTSDKLTDTRKRRKRATRAQLTQASVIELGEDLDVENNKHLRDGEEENSVEDVEDVADDDQPVLAFDGLLSQVNHTNGHSQVRSFFKPLPRVQSQSNAPQSHGRQFAGNSAPSQSGSERTKPVAEGLPIVAPESPPLLLLDDFPFVSTRPMLAQLCSALNRLAQHSATPVVVIMSETTTTNNSSGGPSSSGGWDDIVRRAILAALEDGGASTIVFNPLTPRMILKALTTIATGHRDTSWASDSTHSASLSAIAESSGGDLRRAVCQLQLMLGRSSDRRRGYEGDLMGPDEELWPWDPGGNSGRGRKRSRRSARGGGGRERRRERGKGKGRPESSEPEEDKEKEREKESGGVGMDLRRDHSLTLFHAIGKFLHNKRKQAQEGDGQGRDVVEVALRFQRAEADMKPVEDVLNQAQLEASSLCSFLQENYLDFFDQDAGLDDAASAAAYMSDAMLLLSGPRMSGQFSSYVQSWSAGEDEACMAGPNMSAAAASSVAARGLLFSNAHPAPSKFHAIRAPTSRAAEKKQKEARADIVQRVHNRAEAVGSFPLSIATFITELYSGQHSQHDQEQGKIAEKQGSSVHSFLQTQLPNDETIDEEEDEIEED